MAVPLSSVFRDLFGPFSVTRPRLDGANQTYAVTTTNIAMLAWEC